MEIAGWDIRRVENPGELLLKKIIAYTTKGPLGQLEPPFICTCKHCAITGLQGKNVYPEIKCKTKDCNSTRCENPKPLHRKKGMYNPSFCSAANFAAELQ